MNNSPQKLKDLWQKQTNRKCMREDEGDCAGRLTKEHAIIYAGKQLQEDWAILDICAYHHGVDEFQDCGKLNKEKHVWLALMRATDADLLRISKAINYLQLRERLSKIYGKGNI